MYVYIKMYIRTKSIKFEIIKDFWTIFTLNIRMSKIQIVTLEIKKRLKKV